MYAYIERHLPALYIFREQHGRFDRSLFIAKKCHVMQLHNRNTSVASQRTTANEMHLHQNEERIFRNRHAYRYFHQLDGKRTDNLLVDRCQYREENKRSPHASHAV